MLQLIFDRKVRKIIIDYIKFSLLPGAMVDMKCKINLHQYINFIKPAKF